MPRLGEIFGWGDNPFYQAFDANRQAIIGGFSNMSADPLNPWKGFGQGVQEGAKRDMFAAEQAKEQEQLNQTAEWLKANYPQYAGLPPAEGFRAALAEMGRTQGGANLTAEQRNFMFGQENPEFMDFLGGENRQNISLAGQWGTRNGEPVFLQPSSTGEMIEARLPEGVQLQSPFELNADRSAGRAFGTQVGGAQFSLPQAQLMADQTIKAIEDVRNNKAGLDEQFGSIMGVPQQMTPAWPGSPKANFQVAAQRLTNRAFLEARQMLRGGGQITDFESRKAEGAITNMEDAMARGDKALFLKALDDFEAAVRDGLAKLEQQAGSVPGYGAGQSAPQVAPTQGGYTILGVE